MKKILILLISLMLVVLPLVACGDKNDSSDNTQTNTQTNTSTNTETSTNTSTSTTNTSTNTATGTNTNTNTSTETNTDTNTDVVIPPAPDYESAAVEETIKDDLVVFDKEDEFGVGGTMSDYTTQTVIDVSKVASNAKYIISTGGTYRLTGTSADGQIYIQAKDQAVTLVLDNVSLTNKSFAAPAIYAEDCSKVEIILVGDNYLSDSETNDGEGAVLRVRSCNLTIDGRGTLNIAANAKHGISNTKEITIKGGEFNITAPNQGVYGKLGLTINAGRFNIESGKSGLKSGDTEDLAVGYVNINSGSYDISCGSNGISCNGPVTINDCRFVVNSTNGNAIDATQDVNIAGGMMILNTFKTAITTDANVSISGTTNIKVQTRGNGISANNVVLTTSGVVFIETAPTYELVNAETPADETIYVFVDGVYVVYDPAIHSTSDAQYVMRQCRGIEADGELTVTDGIIGIDSYQDALNIGTGKFTGGKLVLRTTKDAIDATTASISENADITVLASEKGIKATTVVIDGGVLNASAKTDAIKAESTTINGGRVYLLDKIDAGTTGTVTVNGGTVLMITTTNKPQATQGSAGYISRLVVNKDLATAGKWIEVRCGSEVITLELTKDYTEKMAVYFTSPDLNSELAVSIGTYDEANGFISEKTER